MAERTHSFIVKVWLEPPDAGRGRATWRGHVTHVLTRERRYVQDLTALALFIASYLEEMGAGPGLLWRLRRWRHRPSHPEADTTAGRVP